MEDKENKESLKKFENDYLEAKFKENPCKTEKKLLHC